MELKAMADSPPRKGATKRTRKRAYTRKPSLSSSFINMAEARREIVTALQLHRSSTAKNNAALNPTHLQLPQPTTVEVLEVEWFDNDVSASCSWWMAFLSSLDRKIQSAEGPPVRGLDAQDSGSDRDEKTPFTDEWVVFPPGDQDCEQLL